ncbi:unnamed protein product [Arctia plantaginis]|uniref:Fibronectin type-III domain-containing protein n=1 Tax=Arctia plantaginis TaxID=874455 RepID=A0A8S0YUW3_ARCPL|nr:unnamed protein product [Arctia plantaginis]
MIFLYLLSLLVLCDGSPLQEAPSNVELTSFHNQTDSGFVVNWTGVDNRDEADPILGYKVIIREQEVDFAFELKEDGTLHPKKTAADVPSIVFDGKINVLFELKPNGQFVKMELYDMLLKLWQKKAKFVYKLNSEGLLVPLTATDIPALELQHDSMTRVTELEVLANKTELEFNGTKRSYIYEVAVQAFTTKSKGPWSKKTKIVTY